MTTIMSSIARLANALCAVQQTEIAAYDAAGQRIPYVVLCTMYGFV
jgi:hypothetical protein